MRLSISTLRRHYGTSIAKRDIHIRRNIKEDGIYHFTFALLEIVSKETEASSSFQESDVVKEVRESIKEQKRLDDLEGESPYSSISS